jgi:hypothetical protein
MLKNYIPPGCPINLFVRQYNKLLFDRDQEEGFQEKMTILVKNCCYLLVYYMFKIGLCASVALD